MAIAKGNLEIDDFYIGNNEVCEIALGNTSIWKRDHDTFEYDLVLPKTDELDFIFTSDIHCSWINHYQNNSKGYIPTFSFGVDAAHSDNGSATASDIEYYKQKLSDAGIPSLLLDCGDFSQCGSETTSQQNYAVNRYKEQDYFAVTIGNHEWNHASSYTIWDADTAVNCWKQMESDNVKRLVACNLFRKENGVWVQPFKPFKTLKVGKKKIGIIGVANSAFYEKYIKEGQYEDAYQNYFDSAACPAQPSGESGYDKCWWYYERWYDDYAGHDGWSKNKNYIMYDSSSNESTQSTGSATDTNLYKLVQHYIDYLKNENGFDYVIVIMHSSPREAEEFETDGKKGFAKPEYLIKNTHGIDVLIPGHLNESWKPYPSEASPTEYQGVIVKDSQNNDVLLAQCCGAALSSFGRLRFKFNGSFDEITSSLLFKRSQLEEV